MSTSVLSLGRERVHHPVQAPRPRATTVAPHVGLPPAGAAPGHLTDVQRAAGNRAVGILVQRLRAGAAEPVVGADQAARGIITWITDYAPAGQAVNYCVGVGSGGDLIISKVGGVTARTTYLRGLAAYITSQQYDVGRDITLAQAFNTAVGSNHAEMCILAAAGAGALTTIYCSGPHCAFCATVMAKAGVALGAATGNDSQQGWTHPFAPLAYGSQLSATTGDQLAELKGLDLAPTAEQVTAGRWLSSSPAGRVTTWL